MNKKSYNSIKNRIKDLNNVINEFEKTPEKIIIIEGKFRDVKGELEQLKRNPNGYRLKEFYKSKKILESECNDYFKKLESLQSINVNHEINKAKNDIIKLEESIKSFSENKSFADVNSTPSGSNLKSIFPEWGSIVFCDGYIKVKINQSSSKFPVPKSKDYLNKVKHYYSFKNVPKLEIVFTGIEIKEIKNVEVLFYHIDFLTIINQSFETEKFDISKLEKYTKTYFKTHIPYAFTTEALKFLCEICDENFPIIPMPELIINRKESKVIHDSFLFKCGNKLIWESTEISKATYIFELINFDKDAQHLFDYIANENNSNKRQNLIQNYEIKRTLKFDKRIYHNDFCEWKNEIKCNIQC